MSDERFTPSEPGLSHPLTRCAIRLTDDGRTILMAGDDSGMIFDEDTGVVTIFGTEIRFVTNTVKINGKILSDTALISSVGSSSVMSTVRRLDLAREQ